METVIPKSPRLEPQEHTRRLSLLLGLNSWSSDTVSQSWAYRDWGKKGRGSGQFRGRCHLLAKGNSLVMGAERLCASQQRGPVSQGEGAKEIARLRESSLAGTRERGACGLGVSPILLGLSASEERRGGQVGVGGV